MSTEAIAGVLEIQPAIVSNRLGTRESVSYPRGPIPESLFQKVYSRKSVPESRSQKIISLLFII